MVWNALKNNPGLWMTNQQIAKRVDGVAPRTVRAHTQKMVERGLIDGANVFPGPRYRYTEEKALRNAAYVQRVDAASLIFASCL